MQFQFPYCCCVPHGTIRWDGGLYRDMKEEENNCQSVLMSAATACEVLTKGEPGKDIKAERNPEPNDKAPM